MTTSEHLDMRWKTSLQRFDGAHLLNESAVHLFESYAEALLDYELRCARSNIGLNYTFTEEEEP